MARRTYARSSRSTRSTPRRSYRSAPARKSYRSRSAPRRSTRRRAGSTSRTIRIEIVQPTQSAISRPDMIGMKATPAKRKASM